MKKLIAILVVFAVVAGAAFAQDAGSWSVGGSGRIGTRMNFVPIEGRNPVTNHAGVWADGWDQNRDNVKGSLSLGYNKGIVDLGLSFGSHSAIGASLQANGDNWQFRASGDYTSGGGDLNIGIGDLWGNFTFQQLNGIKLEASVSRTGQQWWNTTGIFGDTFTHTKWGNSNGTAVGTAFVVGDGLNSASYLLLDASPMDGLNLGFVVPNLFVYNPSGDDQQSADLLTEALLYTVFGAKYASGPLQAALQFALKGQQAPFYDKDWKVTNSGSDLRSALYIGASFKINDEMSAGAEFRGLFGTQTLVDENGIAQVIWWDPNDGTSQPAGTVEGGAPLATGLEFKDSSEIYFGATFDFNQGPFGVGFRVRYNEPNTAVSHNETIQVRAVPRYDVVEGFLRAELNAELTFREALDQDATAKATDGKPVYASVMSYAIQPALYFNFLGTGAGSWDTGFAFRYRWEGPASYFEPGKGGNTANFLELVFNWKF